MKKVIIWFLVLIALVIVISVVSRSGKPTLSEDNKPLSAEDAVVASIVPYYNDIQGYYVEPSIAGDYPGVVLIHEWWGLNDNIKLAADKLAREGYRVLAVDLYNGKVATATADAQKLVASVKQPEATNNLKAATTFLANKGADKIASFGWCFGGGKSLELAMSGEKLDATVIYYGQLTDDKTKLKNISWPVMGVFGDKDMSISTSSVAAFDKALDELNINNEIYMYPGVGHAFANPSNPGYAPTETADAWAKTLTFLNQHLKPQSKQ